MGKVTGFLEIQREQPSRRKVEDRLQDWFEIYEPFPEEKQREQGADLFNIFGMDQWLKVNAGLVAAARGEVALIVVDVGDAAAHACSEVAAG